MRLSIIIPTRLARHPLTGRYYLERALRSVAGQNALKAASAPQVEIIVGTDAGADLPPEAVSRAPCRVIHAAGAQSQTAAINAALAKASGEVIAFLEDDDFWAPRYLAVALKRLGQYPFVSSNQAEVFPEGLFFRLNDFPTPSGWIMRRKVLERIGGFDDEYRYHLDNEWLGRLNQARVPRLHLIESRIPLEPEYLARYRPHLAHYLEITAGRGALALNGGPHPLVTRTLNPRGGMARLSLRGDAKARSNREYELIRRRFGNIPT
ncbi:MAG: glycosyltransferase [Betaproteobacteria bacterium]|nr:glycosyltransferase [Betaproteobacteria bacterium]